MTEPIVLTPIGVVRGGRSPIFEDHWGAVVSRLVLGPRGPGPGCHRRLNEFSHIEASSQNAAASPASRVAAPITG